MTTTAKTMNRRRLTKPVAAAFAASGGPHFGESIRSHTHATPALAGPQIFLRFHRIICCIATMRTVGAGEIR